MASVVLQIPEVEHAILLQHLLPGDTDDEEAAFLYARQERSDGDVALRFADKLLVQRADFRLQSAGYLELADRMRGRIIKRAHDLDACIVEMHSHPYPSPAAFSPTDLQGLAEFVPHVRWRLKAKPYVAIVVAPSGFDALVWMDEDSPRALDHVRVGERALRPTGLTLQRLADRDE